METLLQTFGAGVRQILLNARNHYCFLHHREIWVSGARALCLLDYPVCISMPGLELPLFKMSCDGLK
jgi:hypothetical protein